MHPSPVLDPAWFSEAERSALRLDGECLPLGLTDVPIGVPVGPAERAASLATATRRYDLVVELRAAAWVHGAVGAPPNPLTLAQDVGRTSRTKQPSPRPREARFRDDDLRRLGGVLVTVPLKTAFDLLRLAPDDDADGIAAALIGGIGLTPTIAAALAQLHLPCPGKQRAIDRLAGLSTRPRAAQPAETR